VQIAKAFGAEVTGVCSTRNLELVRSIGADHVVDYTQEDFTRTGQRYDLIYDTVGNRPIADHQSALSPQGKGIVVGFGGLRRMAEYMLFGPRVSKPGGQQIGLQGTASVEQSDLLALKELFEAGKIIPVIDRIYPLEKTAEAIRYLEQGHARGKVVIAVAD
jgi:NADPH:quinone reductase-like Zn-dependent oxidoreductase